MLVDRLTRFEDKRNFLCISESAGEPAHTAGAWPSYCRGLTVVMGISGHYIWLCKDPVCCRENLGHCFITYCGPVLICTGVRACIRYTHTHTNPVLCIHFTKRLQELVSHKQ